MKNLEVLNICYRYINRFISSNELIELLCNVDKTKLNEEEINQVDNLIKEITEICNSIPNIEDELVLKEKETIKKIMRSLEEIPQNEGNQDFINRQLETLKKDYDREHDCHERWLKIMNDITNNEYFINCYDSLTEYELLDFVTQYINVPIPPTVDQDEFEKLVNIGIENNDKESLFRLAFNYARKSLNLDSIFDYFISKKDGYHISELISSIGEYLDITSIFEKINELDLINDLLRRKLIMSDNVSDKEWNILSDKLNSDSTKEEI